MFRRKRQSVRGLTVSVNSFRRMKEEQRMQNARGRCCKYGDNVDTDVIIPARYLAIQDKEELARHAMEDIDADFRKKLKPGDLVVAGRNFGCGSSREHAPQVLQSSGVSCVIAESFARIFYRNALNIGLPILEAAEAVRSISEGDELEVDFIHGRIRNLSSHQEFSAMSFPAFLQRMIDCGGLLNYINAGNSDTLSRADPIFPECGRGKL